MGWLWYLGTMLPMIGFIQTGRQAMADRFMHIPMMGLLFALVWLIADLAAEKHWQKEIPIALFLLALAPFAAVTSSKSATGTTATRFSRTRSK